MIPALGNKCDRREWRGRPARRLVSLGGSPYISAIAVVPALYETKEILLSPVRRLVLSLFAVAAVVVIGSIGYLLIEPDRDVSLLDAVYMTVITASTVGFTEVWEHSDAGRIWTMTIIAFGIGTVTIAFTSLLTLFVSGELQSARERRQMDQAIEKRSDHTIVCGYGRMGSLAARELSRKGASVVVIEKDHEKEDELRESGVAYLLGDATDEDILIRAGVMRAATFVAVLPRDPDNVFITVSVHTLRPELKIIARAEQPATEAKLIRAGASRVVCPQSIGAARIANIVTRPNVVDVIDLANKGISLEMDEHVVTAVSPLVGKSLRDTKMRTRTGASVVAIKRADGETLFTPDPNVLIEQGDTLILVGPIGLSTHIEKF